MGAKNSCIFMWNVCIILVDKNKKSLFLSVLSIKNETHLDCPLDVSQSNSS